MGAIAAAIALHAAVLILRPGVSGGHLSASSTPTAVLAVRMLPSAHEALSAAQRVDTVVAAPIAAATDREPIPSSPMSKAAGDAKVLSDHPAAKTDPSQPAHAPSRLDPSTTAGSALSAAPEYALGIKLDPGPHPIEDIDPDYPDTLKLRSGTVVLRLLISDTGHVDEVGIVRADPPGVFEQAAIDAFSKARFAPGMAGGRPVKSQIRIEVEFMPINRGARTSGHSY